MRNPPSNARSWFWSALVVVAGVAVAIIIARYQVRYEHARQDAQFQRQSDMAFNAIRQQVEAGAQMVRAMQASFMVSEEITQDDFTRLYESLNPKAMFPGLQAMVYSRRVKGADGQDHYWTMFVAPLDGNERLQNFDLARQPRNIAAIKISEKTRQPAMSEPFHLIQDSPNGASGPPLGITIRIPVYSTNGKRSPNDLIIGSMGVSFRINDLIGSALPSGNKGGVAVVVSDITQTHKLLYELGAPSAGYSPRRERFGLGGRVWEVSMAPMYSTSSMSPGPIITFLSISSLGVLLSILVFNLLRTRERALSLAHEMSSRFRQSEERFRMLNENLPGMVVLSDGQGVVAYVNRSCRSRMDINSTQALTVMDLFRVPALIERLNALPDGVEQLHMPRVQLTDRFGKEFWASLSFSRMKLEGVTHIMALGSDVSEIIDMSQQLEFQAKQLHFQATHDQLTGLVNRREFEERLSIAIHEAGHGIVSSLMYIDLDQFKVINDTAGHMVGDRLLMQAADGMRTLLGNDEILARMGGDEFAVLVRSSTTSQTQDLGERVRRFFEDFLFVWEGVPYKVSCSIGMVMVDRGGMTQEEVLSRADSACYMAKERGRNRWQFFDEGRESAARRVEMEWVGRIRQAISSQRLCLHYQDIVAIGHNPRPGNHFEILVRMKDETGKLISAGEFIPAAERYGLMPLIDRWVMETALANFDRLHPGDDIETCAINLSGETVDDPNFEEFLINALLANPVAASKICIEITETSAIRNMSRLLEFIPRLRATGCRLALDDFGAGMSSFGYLKNLKVDMVKIDGSFIRDLDHDAMSNSIVIAVTDIAHKMGMEVVAEWVGSQATLNLLREMGVNYAQGFYLHMPSACPFEGCKDD